MTTRGDFFLHASQSWKFVQEKQSENSEQQIEQGGENQVGQVKCV